MVSLWYWKNILKRRRDIEAFWHGIKWRTESVDALGGIHTDTNIEDTPF
jgi:hypothetical protein